MEKYPFYIELTCGYYRDNTLIKNEMGELLFAETYTEAVSIIEENYGNELISINRVESFGDSVDTIPVPIAIGRQFVKDVNKYHERYDESDVVKE